MSTSRNFTELQTIWKGWRDVSGKKMKEKYAEFVELSNQGIKELDLGTCDFSPYNLPLKTCLYIIKIITLVRYIFRVPQHFGVFFVATDYLFVKYLLQK